MNQPPTEPRRAADGLPQVFLEPGTLYCSTKPVMIRTVLGSCVAVCLVDRHGRAAGMNHYVLPACPESKPSLRYGDVAIRHLIARMLRFGCGLTDLRAKVFGGAAVLPFGLAEDTVGSKNVTIGLELLRDHSIPVVARRTGGENGLLIRLYTATGRVMVRPIAGRMAQGRVSAHDTQADGLVQHPASPPGIAPPGTFGK